MNEKDKNQWITGPKARKTQSGGWRDTEALMKARKINPFAPQQNPLGRRIVAPEDEKMKQDFESPAIYPSSDMGQGVFSENIESVNIYKKDTAKTPPSVEELLLRDTSDKGNKILVDTPLIKPLIKSLSLNTDEMSKTYVQQKMMENIKSQIPLDSFSEFDYYEGHGVDTGDEEIAVVHHAPVGKPQNRTGEFLEKMIAYSPSSRLTQLMMRELELLGEILLGECQEFGIGIIIFEKGRNLTQIKIDNQLPFPPGTRVRDGRGWETVRGAYNPQHRMMFMAEELVTGKPGGVSTHEFGHAYDHAWQINNDMKFGFSVFLWNQFYNERTFITEYAATQPKEYFAVSLESYFNPHRKELLKKCDPRMYGFITNMIAGVHKQPKRQLSE